MIRSQRKDTPLHYTPKVNYHFFLVSTVFHKPDIFFSPHQQNKNHCNAKDIHFLQSVLIEAY